jgi:hypothetical protein
MLLILLESWSCEPPFVAQFITRVFGTNFERGAAGSYFFETAQRWGSWDPGKARGIVRQADNPLMFSG